MNEPLAGVRDVAQETLLKVLDEWRAPERPVAWGAWLIRVAINTCHRRRRSRWWRGWHGAVEEFQETEFQSDDGTPENSAMGRQQRHALAAKLFSKGTLQAEDLTPAVQQIVRLRDQLMQEGVKVALEVRGILTPDQLAKGAEIRERMDELHTEMKKLLGEPPSGFTQELPPPGGSFP